MTIQYKTAEELMEYLKKQIIHYSDYKEILEDKFEMNKSYEISGINNYNNFKYQVDLNNNLWNVSANRPISSHRKYIGKLIISIKRLIRKTFKWYVGDTFDLQTAFNSSVTNSFNELNNLIIIMNENFKTQEARNINQEKIINELEHVLRNKESEIIALQNSVNKQTVSFNDKIEELNELKKYLFETSKQKIEIDTMLNFYEKQIKEILKEVGYWKSKHNGIHELIEAHSSQKSLLKSEQKFDYVAFENQFRGSNEDIKNRQKKYLEYFYGKDNVLDIGCGRGEFLELLIEHNSKNVQGIDINADMIELCMEKSLPVMNISAIEYLESLEDNSLGGIFMGQVIEHMPFEEVIELTNIAYRKLKPESYLIMETPNPRSLSIFYRYFYVDPTHVKPVHPLTIKFVAESAGFSKVETIYSAPVDDEILIPQIESDNINNIEQLNESFKRVNELLYGNQDYAVLAMK